MHCRYYGKSKPFPPKELRQHMEYLSADQALVRLQPAPVMRMNAVFRLMCEPHAAGRLC